MGIWWCWLPIILVDRILISEIQRSFNTISYRGKVTKIIFVMLILFLIISFFFNLLTKQLMHLLCIDFIEKRILWYLIITATTLNNATRCIWYFRRIWILVLCYKGIITFLFFGYSLLLFYFFQCFYFGRNFWGFNFFYLFYIFIFLNIFFILQLLFIYLI